MRSASENCYLALSEALFSLSEALAHWHRPASLAFLCSCFRRSFLKSQLANHFPPAFHSSYHFPPKVVHLRLRRRRDPLHHGIYFSFQPAIDRLFQIAA
jgi:hypothetical protein